jgi:small neutral amino acid transporter SnatA (MarC family)
LLGLVIKKIILPAASLMLTLMLGAIIMHFKIDDEAIKFLPAGLLFVFSLAVLYLNKKEKS